MFSPSPSGWKMVKILPITFQRIWLVKLRPHTKFMRTIYIYIPSSFNCSNPVRPCSVGFIRTWVGITLSTSCAEVIVICICSVVQRETHPYFHMFMWVCIIWNQSLSTAISHIIHHRLGSVPVPLSRITNVSLTFRCMKCTIRFDLLFTFPGKPYKGTWWTWGTVRRTSHVCSVVPLNA